MVGEVITPFRVLVLIDIVVVTVCAWLFTQPRYVPCELARECYTTLLGSTGAPQCPTAAHNFMMTYSPVIMAILAGVVLLSTHIRVFSDHRNPRPRDPPGGISMMLIAILALTGSTKVIEIDW
ncbi:hypothetical protein [Rhodococcus qingshengii]|uniref:hypothetical protein n=1 Tax=Rhodococcus qingshengii TaxID=334542 RepID=UPI001ADEFDE8|nr:hypothetical protein [Rhodococcus qingshengii]